jgi:cytochrome o ubiquinol oxidase subunit 2
VPLRFELTSSSVMNVFFIPQFGSMIYTMNGMATQLNLRADRPGTFQGLSAHFSGDGFSDMHFDVHVVPSEQFSEWAQQASHADKSLDEASYGEIARPSTKSQPAIYRLADPQLFHAIVTQKLPPSPGFQAGVKGADLPAGGADAR